MGLKFLSVICVNPAIKEKVGAPTEADRNTEVHLISSLKVSPPSISKKLEFDGFRPLPVNPMAMVLLVGPVFFTVRNRVTYSKRTSFISSACNVDDVKNGTADIWYAGV
jgi:hypothetical protein